MKNSPNVIIGQRALNEVEVQTILEMGFYVRFLTWNEDGKNVYEISAYRG